MESGFNCTQAVLSTYADVFGLDREAALKLSTGFGIGMGGMGDTCGAVTGAFMVLGLRYGASDPDDRQATRKTYQQVRSFAAKFKARHASILCRELVDLGKTAKGAYAAEEQFSTRCPKMVQTAVDILEEMLGEMGCDDQ
jgi:C_GCAxxG_C_C family probable redox protein